MVELAQERRCQRPAVTSQVPPRAKIAAARRRTAVWGQFLALSTCNLCELKSIWSASHKLVGPGKARLPDPSKPCGHNQALAPLPRPQSARCQCPSTFGHRALVVQQSLSCAGPSTSRSAATWTGWQRTPGHDTVPLLCATARCSRRLLQGRRAVGAHRRSCTASYCGLGQDPDIRVGCVAADRGPKVPLSGPALPRYLRRTA
jgi:hypothetical protein